MGSTYADLCGRLFHDQHTRTQLKRPSKKRSQEEVSSGYAPTKRLSGNDGRCVRSGEGSLLTGPRRWGGAESGPMRSRGGFSFLVTGLLRNRSGPSKGLSSSIGGSGRSCLGKAGLWKLRENLNQLEIGPLRTNFDGWEYWYLGRLRFS